MSLISILLGILAIGILALVHELGHFVMAKASKVGVEELSIGMGPKLFSVKGKKTAYSLRLLPFFAYVKMKDEGEGGILNASILQRFFMYIGGVLFNFLLGILIFAIIGITAGFITDKVIVGDLVPDSPAVEAGLEKGDILLSVDGDTLTGPADFQERIQAGKGASIDLGIERNGEGEKIMLTPVEGEGNRYQIGIYFGKEQLGFFNSIGFAFKTTFETIGNIFGGLGMMITGQAEAEFTGPIGIVTMASSFTQRAEDYFLFIAILSTSMGVFNLLPIPALDGGKIVFLLIEKLRGKKVNEKVEYYTTLVGFGLLILLIIYATFGDIARLMGG